MRVGGARVARRGLVPAVSVGLVVGLGCGGARAPATDEPRDDPWPMFRREARHGGDARDRGPLAWELAWSHELGARVDASPIVVAAGVVVATRTGVVVVLDPEGGAERARAELGGDVWATPAASAGTIVIGVRRDSGGELVGLDAGDLAVRWRRPVVSGGFGAATAAGRRVWLCNGAAVVAIDPDDGAELAHLTLDQRCYGAPAIDGGALYVASRDGALRSFDVRTGARRWQAITTAGAFNEVAPVVTDDLVLIGSNDGHLYGFGPGGDQRWRAGDGDWVVSSPAVADGLAVFGDDGGVERAVALADGRERWRGKVGNDVASSAVVIGDHVVHGAHDGKLHAWRLTDGVARPPIDAGAPMFASPAVTGDGLVVIATHAGRVVAIR